MKCTFRYMNTIAVLLASVAVMAFSGCKEADDHYVTNGAGGDIYVIFGESATTDLELSVDHRGYVGTDYAGDATYDMYTNASEWQIVPDYSQCFDPDISWIESWPAEGNDDGRFTLTFTANTVQGETRYADVNIVSNGQVIQTIKVKQEQAQSVLLDIVAIRKYVNCDANAYVATIPVNANVFWEAETDDVWITLSGKTNSKIDLNIEPNDTGAERKGTVTVYQVSNPKNVQYVEVTQSGEVSTGE